MSEIPLIAICSALSGALVASGVVLVLVAVSWWLVVLWAALLVGSFCLGLAALIGRA